LIATFILSGGQVPSLKLICPHDHNTFKKKKKKKFADFKATSNLVTLLPDNNSPTTYGIFEQYIHFPSRVGTRSALPHRIFHHYKANI
jgi:hypothetical protein